jgi:hypothetical protein
MKNMMKIFLNLHHKQQMYIYIIYITVTVISIEMFKTNEWIIS